MARSCPTRGRRLGRHAHDVPRGYFGWWPKNLDALARTHSDLTRRHLSPEPARSELRERRSQREIVFPAIAEHLRPLHVAILLRVWLRRLSDDPPQPAPCLL